MFVSQVPHQSTTLDLPAAVILLRHGSQLEGLRGFMENLVIWLAAVEAQSGGCRAPHSENLSSGACLVLQVGGGGCCQGAISWFPYFRSAPKSPLPSTIFQCNLGHLSPGISTLWGRRK